MEETKLLRAELHYGQLFIW